MLQSMTIATANVMHVDAILDSGATASIFPLNYQNLSKFCKYPTPYHATMADSASKLTLYGTAMYGSIPVIVGDLQLHVHGQGLINFFTSTGPPNNLTILKTGSTAWILDPDKTPDDPTGFYATVRRRAIICIISKTPPRLVLGDRQYLSATVS